MELILNNTTPTICLNMIVKNESKIITRLFDSVLPIIDCLKKSSMFSSSISFFFTFLFFILSLINFSLFLHHGHKYL